MKKHLYIVASFVALLFTACDPMEEVYDELDEQAAYSKDIAVTLTADQYEAVEDADGVPAYVWEDNYFASEEEAAGIIPMILNESYPQLERGSIAQVTYNKLVVPFSNTFVKTFSEYTVTEGDYDALGFAFGNFSKYSEIVAFLEYRYPDVAEKDLVELTYTWYNGSANPSTYEVTDRFFYINGNWEDAYLVSQADYESVNHTNYTFSSSDGDNFPLYLDKFLRANILGATAGDVQYVSYAYYSSSSKTTSQRVTAMLYDGTRWIKLDDNVTANATIQFKKEANGTWKPDLSIKYTLTGADYGFIGNAANGFGTSASRDNLNAFGNINTSSWSDEAIVQALAAVLKMRFPDVEAGQKIAVTYDTYPAGLLQKTFVMRETGEFTEAQEGE
ncbi:hypothetical protein MKJ04_13140 [Pontibacter sp. E15-1]|uniref:hypothetical protein n=1 Tax=Pontibacter sp. E15-1 TaxID=2919918 RepID=UPI001F4FF3DD|nr:hypothetical protein [Pontibacter sp. E15-1]MCJ8165791.1 hypothetical protein [Pontibacter sp. E15-1]